MSANLGPIELSEPMLQCLLAEYLQEIGKAAPEKAGRLSERLQSDLAAYRGALQALTEAVVFSTLACVVEDFDDFAREADALRWLHDEDLQRMRQTVFMEGMRTGVESIGFDLANQMKLSERVEFFNRAVQAA